MKTWTKSVSDSPRRRARTAGVCELKARMLSRKREVVDTENDDARSSSREFEVSQLDDGGALSKREVIEK